MDSYFLQKEKNGKKNIDKFKGYIHQFIASTM